jgi:hypothetical protein
MNKLFIVKPRDRIQNRMNNQNTEEKKIQSSILSLEELRLQIDEPYVGSSNQKMITDDQFVLHVLNTLPEEYDHMVAQLACELEKEDNKETITKISEKLGEQYEKTNDKRWGSRNEDSGETALFTTDTSNWKPTKQFQGRCNFCGRIGHKTPQCKQLHRCQ